MPPAAAKLSVTLISPPLLQKPPRRCLRHRPAARRWLTRTEHTATHAGRPAVVPAACQARRAPQPPTASGDGLARRLCQAISGRQRLRLARDELSLAVARCAVRGRADSISATCEAGCARERSLVVITTTQPSFLPPRKAPGWTGACVVRLRVAGSGGPACQQRLIYIPCLLAQP